MAFAQLTDRESLRDIEALPPDPVPQALTHQLPGTGAALDPGDANATRDWRDYAEFAQRLIAPARRLFAQEDLGLELTNTV
jgi:hypothetical protein